MEPGQDSCQRACRGGRAGRASAVALTAIALAAAAGCGGGGGGGTTQATSTAASATTPATTTATTTATSPSPAAPTLAAAARRVQSQLRGIAQSGLVLGDPKAPVTIVEYGRFDCPACTGVHGVVVPRLIERDVRTGRASLEFRGLAPDTASAARALVVGAYAASAQGRGWDFLQLAYRRSLDHTASGTDVESPTRIAHALGLDMRRFRADLKRPAWSVEIAAARSVAAVGRFQTFPVFLVRPRSTPQAPYVVVVGPEAAGRLAAAVAKASHSTG